MYISVIVPVYNAEKWLDECLQSILAQTFTDFELLLINDGSSDRSDEICRRYALADNRIRLFNISNSGVSAARNLGLDNACGERIVFVDADDTVTPDHLERFVSADAGDCGIVYCSMNEEHRGRVKTRRLQDVRIGNDAVSCKRVAASLMRSRAFGWTCNKMFSRALIERLALRFERGLNYAEDEVFTIRYYAYIDSVTICSRPTYNYRYVASSLLHRGVAPEQYVAVRQMIASLYESENFGGECCYLSYRTMYSRLRSSLRSAVRRRDEDDVLMLTNAILAALREMKRCRRREFLRQTYDFKIMVTSFVVSLCDKPSWVRFAVAKLHL